MTKDILELRKKNLWENIQELETLLKDLKDNLSMIDEGVQLLQKRQLEKQILEREDLMKEYIREYEDIQKQLVQESAKQLDNLYHSTENIIEDLAFIKSQKVVNISLHLDEDFEHFKDQDLNNLLASLRYTLRLEGKIKIQQIERGSVIISLEMTPEDAEKLYIAIKLHKLDDLNIKDIKLISFVPVDANNLDLKDVKIKIKQDLAKDIKDGIVSLEDILNEDSNRYNDFLQLKGNFNQSNKMFDEGRLKFEDFKIEMNKCLTSFINLVENLTGVDIYHN